MNDSVTMTIDECRLCKERIATLEQVAFNHEARLAKHDMLHAEQSKRYRELWLSIEQKDADQRERDRRMEGLMTKLLEIVTPSAKP